MYFYTISKYILFTGVFVLILMAFFNFSAQAQEIIINRDIASTTSKYITATTTVESLSKDFQSCLQQNTIYKDSYQDLIRYMRSI